MHPEPGHKRGKAAKRASQSASVCAFALGACLLLLLPIHGQDSNSALQPVSTLKSQVRVVLVDVVVTDKNGQPVTGLTKDDFEVSERTNLLAQGQKQSIVSFEEHRGLSEAGAVAPQLPPHVYTNEPSLPTSSAVNVLLLDALNTPLGDQSTVRGQMIDYLKKIEPGPRLAIFTLSSQLRMVEGFTVDPHTLLAALNRKKGGGWPKPSALTVSAEGDAQNRGIQQMGEVEELAEAPPGTPAQAPGSSSISDAILALKRFQEEMKTTDKLSRVSLTLSALKALASYLSGYPGRKNIIWFSGSFPALSSMSTNMDTPLDADDRGVPAAVRRTVNALASAQVSLYPVSSKGLDTGALYDASRLSARTPEPPRKTAKPGGPPPRQGANIEGQKQIETDDSLYRSLNNTAMDDLARDTGGKAFYSTNGLKEALADAVRTGSHYYSISYSPDDKTMLGRYRHIEVKLRKGRYSLSYRRGYYEEGGKSTNGGESSVALDHLTPIMTRGLPESTQIVYRLRVSPLTIQPASDAPIAGDNKDLHRPITRVSVDFVLPVSQFTLNPAADGVLNGDLEFGLIAYDQDGKPLNWLFRSIRPKLKPELYPQVANSGAHFHQEIDVPQSDLYLRAGVFDIATNRAGTLEIKIPNADLTGRMFAEDLSELLNRVPPRHYRHPLPDPHFEREAAAHAETAGVSASAIPNSLESGTAQVFQNESDLVGYCANVARSAGNAPALAKTCELALSIRKKLPDILCDREMKRTWSEFAFAVTGALEEKKYSDTVTAKLRYTEGQEHYEDVRLNGKPADVNSQQLWGTWSAGELSTTLMDVFLPSARTSFRFEKEATLHSRKALLFTYQVQAQNNQTYFLQVNQKFWLPEYSGRLWLDEQTLHLLRLERETTYMPNEPIRRMTTSIDYEDLSMGDGTALVLPVRSNVQICMAPPMSSLGDVCSRHSITFTNWHKFRGTAKILPSSAN